jgi:hypothetical protein
MNSLFLAWQDTGPSRAWFPIGRLDADLPRSRFTFGYTHGAERASHEAGLRPLESFPDFKQIYQSNELFPLFRNRVMDEGRVDFVEYLHQLDIDPNDANPINILAVTGGKRQTDNLQVFPKIERQADDRFCCRFFIHGNRYANAAAQTAYNLLKAGDQLRIALELNNPATRLALQLETSDYHMIGWAPRYLIGDLKKAIDDSPDAVTGTVVKVNPAPAPANQRVLVELTGRLPHGHSPMSDPDFQLISASFIS